MPFVPDPRDVSASVGPKPGDRLGRYDVVARTGATRFDGWDAEGGRGVEIRVIASAAPWAERALAHAGRVRLTGARVMLDGGTTDGFTWWAMPAARRPTLAEVVQQGPLEPVTAFRLGCAIADRLAAIHGAGLVLGALDPVDIGGARGQVCTVPVWTGAPLDGSVDRRIDVYRLGVLWHLALTGREPDAPTPRRPTDLGRLLRLDLDATLVSETMDLMSDMLAFRPADRPYPIGPLVDRMRDLTMICSFATLRRKGAGAATALASEPVSLH